MKALWIAVLALVPSIASAQQKLFCRVDNVGNQTCMYGTLNACQSAVATLGGACALEQPTAKPKGYYDVNAGMERPNMVEAYRQGQEHALKMRQAEQDLKARQAQTARPEPRLEVNGGVMGYWVMYRCPKGDGWEYTGTPAPGCVVEDVTFY